jgi:transcriptional regulator with XRE-family HTH domain
MKSFKTRLQEIRQTHEYRVAKVKLEFVRAITRLMRANDMSGSELAEKMHTSNAYISKALRGDTNFTIDSMVKLSHALGGRLHIHIADENASVRWFEVYANKAQPNLDEAAAEVKKLTGHKNAIDVKNFFKECEHEERRIFA